MPDRDGRSPLKLFYSYSHKDEKYLDRLLAHMTGLREKGIIEEWWDRRMRPGDGWEGDIDTRLETADIILLLVSPDYLQSHYCYKIETPRAMERHREGSARVVPVMLWSCRIKEAPFFGLVSAPADWKPIEESQHPNQLYKSVADDIAELAVAVSTQRSRKEQEKQKAAAAASISNAVAVPVVVNDAPVRGPATQHASSQAVSREVKSSARLWFGLVGIAVVLAVGVAVMGNRQQGGERPGSPTQKTKEKVMVNTVDRLEYVWIPPGRFTMGCSPGDTECADDEKPAHPVEIKRGFWLGKTEVTQAAYLRVTGSNPSHFKGEDLPVEMVDWTAAKNYCVSVGGRLPTEAEWEYAARGGSQGARYGALGAIAWYNLKSGSGTQPVKTKEPNAYGLYDMLGNVREWTADWKGEYPRSLAVDPKGAATGTERVLRGGGWYDDARFARASYRNGGPPDLRYLYLGFRCVRE